METGCLDRETIYKYLGETPKLIDGYLNLDAQLQPNGFDMTLEEIRGFQISKDIIGTLTFEHSGRVLPPTTPLKFDAEGMCYLEPGPYLIRLNEVVNLPNHIMALARPRSSLLRSGVSIHNAVWDAGYQGRSQALLTVYHPSGFMLSRNARVLQLVFFYLVNPVTRGYEGQFLGEGLP